MSGDKENGTGMSDGTGLSREDRQAVAALAAADGLEPAAVLAVIGVESGGRVLCRVDGRMEPPIRWEGHYFDRLCRPDVRERARAAGLSSPTPGAIANPAGQAGRWRILREAAALDREAAYSSVSWGVGQVMGAHWRALGYASVEALADEARSGLEGQARLMLRFIGHCGLAGALRAHDWARFASVYNGPAYRRNGYDSRLAAAYAACSDGGGAPGDGVLRCGAAGEAVAQMQRRLVAAGATLAVDGRFGARTEAALEAFQREAGLPADGIAGPRTLAALRSAGARGRSWPARLAVLVRRLVRFLGRGPRPMDNPAGKR